MGRTACVLLAVFALLFASVELGLAKRLGGGGSMGNRQSFSTSTTPRPDMGSPSGSFSSQQARPNPTHDVIGNTNRRFGDALNQ